MNQIFFIDCDFVVRPERQENRTPFFLPGKYNIRIQFLYRHGNSLPDNVDIDYVVQQLLDKLQQLTSGS